MPQRVGRRRGRMLASRQHNLPAPHRSLVGREDDTVTVRDLMIHAPGRLVTLTGTGGCGKTQLALKVATDFVNAFHDGVWFVDLASLNAPHLVAYAVAAVLGCRGRGGEAIEDTLLQYLTDRDVLLVLDNCEHLIDACASLAERVLSGCPRVRLLATSRERLRIAGETAWRVPSLASPDPRVTLAPAELLEYPAVQLFVERAQAVQTDFVLGPANASSVAALCVRLEGLPLALELAAARMPALSLPQIQERLADSFRLLVGGSRTAPTRQQTLRATLDWSLGLLSRAEQEVFRRLAVFAGGWTLEAAEAVCTDDAITAADLLELHSRLVDKSLVMVGEGHGDSRYRLLEPLRQYAWEQLTASSELDAVRQRHATFVLAFAEALERDVSVGGAQRVIAAETIEGEYRNLQLALRWALDTGNADVGLRLARTLQFVWKFRMPAGEGRLWVEELLRMPGADAPTPARAVALLTAAWFSWPGDADATAALYAEALALARRLGDPWILFVALADRGLEAQYRGDYLTARSCWQEALPTTQRSGDRSSEAILLTNLRRLVIYEGDYAGGRAQCEEALHLARELSDVWLMAGALVALALAALALGELTAARALATECLSLQPDPFATEDLLRTLAQVDIAEGCYTDARRHLERALAIAQDNVEPAILAGVVDTLAGLAARLGQPDIALRLAAAAEAELEALGVADLPVNGDLRGRWLVRLRASLRGEDAGRWWAEGRSLSLNEAIALAELELPQTPTMSPHSAAGEVLGPLTPRQQEVAVLVGQGLTNRQIGDRLVITERAAGAHIEHILDRLGVGSRAQIAVWASERGLLTPRSG